MKTEDIPAGLVFLSCRTSHGNSFAGCFDPGRIVIDILKGHRGNTLWSLAIQQAQETNTNDHWDKLLDQLASQANDNLPVMADIVGPLAAYLLAMMHKQNL